jgi:hypothetical protein
MTDLRVPLAVDREGRLHSPENADKSREYFCPACQASVILKQGQVRIAHFAHKASEICTQETIVHQTAKLLVQKSVSEWKEGRSTAPVLQRKCQICGSMVSQPLPDNVEKAVVEYRLVNGLIADIALLAGEELLAIVEIKVTHAVDDMKADRLDRLAVPFIELDGQEVIENPAVWKPLTDRFKPITCENCKAIYSEFQRKVREVAQSNGIDLPTKYYCYGLWRCWKCKREIIVFAGPTNGLSAPNILPRPKTIRYGFSKITGEKYWVNTCPFCQSVQSIQGDYFLYCDPNNSPFSGIDIKEDTLTSLESDLMRIAVHAKRIGLL